MLKQTIQTAATESLKSKDTFTTGTLRMLLASIGTKEKDKRYKISKDPAFAKASAGEESLNNASQLTDEEIIEVISSEIKKRKDAIALYEKGNRPELAEKEQKEIEIFKKYLPEQLSDEELRKLIKESIVKVGGPNGHPEVKDIGKIMADLMPKVKGKADGGEISKIIKELLSK